MTDPRAARHADQTLLIRHLAETVRARLAGEDDAGARLVGREPREVVVLGVLPPQRALPPAPPQHPDIPDEPGVPIDVLPRSEMGLTTLVDPGTDRLGFDVDCRFSIYLQEIPTYAEQLAFVVGAADDDDTPGDTDGDADGDGGDSDSSGLQVRPPATATTGPAPVPTAPPTAPPATPPTATPAAGAPAGPRRAQTVALRPIFRRIDITAPLHIDVAVPDGPSPVYFVDDATLNAAIDAAVAGIDTNRLARPLTGRGQRIPTAVVHAGEADYDAEIARRTDRSAPPPLPRAAYSVYARREGPHVRVNLTVHNSGTEMSAIRGFRPSLTLYNTRFRTAITGGDVLNMGYALAESDWRVCPEVYSHGRFCVGERDGNTVWTTTWPIFTQKVYESRRDVEPSFTDLIADPVGPLQRIAAAMETFLADWDTYVGGAGLRPADDAACRAARAAFADETVRFTRGIDLLRTEPALRQAFVQMNETFALINTPGGLDLRQALHLSPTRVKSWYVFQIVFVVAGLASLAARQAPDGDPLIDELSFADVLWFPTGGGKSEAFLGLLCVALFYDRARGKDIGVTGVVRFPLRMLSVQQLGRVLAVVAGAERIRSRDTTGGTPFRLGYLVGKANTPNQIAFANDEKWHDLRWMARQSADWLREKVIIPVCCYCDSEDVTLEPDPDAVRLWHRCGTCGEVLPVDISDDEVFRYLPSVVVATVDKLAAIAYNAHFSHLTHGPRYECPAHGYVTFPRGPRRQQRCLARTYCSVETKDWQPVTVVDPAPALVIQDELHLLAEELGTFNAHYETLWGRLSAAVTGRPSKVLAATATISDYENQVRHLYALEPRRFPSEGYADGSSFYAVRQDHLTRRVFAGALPDHMNAAEFAVAAGTACRGELERLRGLDPAAVVALLGLTHYGPAEVAGLLFRYELQLTYTNKKTDCDWVAEQLSRAGKEGDPAYFAAVPLNGTTPLADISAAIRRVTKETEATPAGDRLAGVVGTSLVSHGVDLERLNVMHMAGFPRTTSYYVQATSRCGRTDVGLIFAAFSPFARDRAAYHFFDPQHRYVNHLVEPVSLNRFSVHGPKKTATGIMSAIIINLLARDPAVNPTPRPADRPLDLTLTQNFQRVLAANGTSLETRLRDEVRAAYGLGSGQFDPILAGHFARIVDERVAAELAELRSGTARTIQRAFLKPPPTSFRDIDEPVTFSPKGRYASNEFRTLTAWDDHRADPNREAAPAEEKEDDDGA
jgi:hypothetical protein